MPARRAARRKVVVDTSTGSRVLEQGRVRLLCVGLFFLLCFGSLEARLIEMMLSNPLHGVSKTASKDALVDPEDGEVTIASTIKRGNITDRNGVLVATSLMTASAYANPKELRDPDTAALRLEKAIGTPHETLLKRFKGDKSFVWIKRHLTPAEQQAVNTLGIPGIYFASEEQRVYPYGNLLSHVIGYVGIDDRGLAGIEKHFDDQLMEDRPIPESLQLSLDVRVQHIVRDEVRRAVDEFRAIGGTGVVLDVKTGEIISMVSLPDFDPHKPAKAQPEQKFNRATLGTYEPGSTFKTFTFALALDNKIVGMKDGYDASHPLKYANFTIADTHPKGRWLSLPEIYAYSSNIGTAKMLLDIGVKRQRAFMEAAGMLKPLDIELPERAAPQYPKEWRELNALTIAYGHGISVSPLHLARGIATLVGGGTLPKLTLVKGSNQGKAEGERLVSADTSRQIRRLMRLVVLRGTGEKADVPGYRVGGKTGTAEKIAAGGSYSKHNNLASFVATFPADDPRYVVLVMVDEPKGTKASNNNATGGWVAAPAVGHIVERMAPLMDVRPQFQVTADDAEKYWVDTDPNGPKKPSSTRFVHAAAFGPR